MASPKSSELAAALAEIRARRLDGVALVAPFALDPADIESLVAAPAVRWVGQRGKPNSAASGDTVLVEDDGGTVPDGIRHIFFLGAWRALPPPLRRRARQLKVTNFLCLVGERWRHPPTPGHLAKAVFYKAARPVLEPIGRGLHRAFGRLVPDANARLRRRILRLARRGEPGLVPALSVTLPLEDVLDFLALPGLAGLVLPQDGPHPAGGNPRLGFWSGDSWSLPAGVRRVYLFGRWRTLGRRALVSAIERRLDRLAVPLGPFWLPLPLPLLGRLLEIYRRVPDLRLTPALFRSALGDGTACDDCVPGRVVLVCGSLAPGGAERQVANTLLGLAAKGLDDVQLLCDYLTPGQPSRYDFYLPMLRRAGIVVREIALPLQRVDAGAASLPKPFRRAARRMPVNLAADIANLYLEFRALRPEVVHAFLDWSSVRAGMAAALAGVPRIVLSGRNVNPSHFALYQRYMDPIYQVLAERPEISFVNNSEAGARDYEGWLGLRPGQIGVLRNGVDFEGGGRASVERIRAIRTALGVPQTAPLIGGVFRLFPEKRPMLWVEAAAEIARRRADARFVIWGQGVLEQELRDRIRACGLEDRLVLAGVTEDALSAISALDIFMLTSFKEGTPNVVLEAQRVGTPVVAVEAGGTREALEPGQTGWIVDPPTASGLADQICRLLDDPALRAECLSAGPAFVEARFGLGRMVEDTLAAYGFDARLAPRRQAGAA